MIGKDSVGFFVAISGSKFRLQNLAEESIGSDLTAGIIGQI